ncbi:MAG: DNA-directed RNA polymerase subunit alpha [Patescibacteria group bacterium]|jgi:DNA-directed RNA polymerase subunit alpha
MIVEPSDLKIETVSEKDNVGVFSFEPLPTGLGHTLGNALRRVLLTSIKGAAATQVRLNGVKHQFTTVEGVKEDVVEITLNLKDIRFRCYVDTPVVVTISKKGAGEIKAKDINCTSDVEVINKDAHIATLTDSKATFEAELVIETGYGYSPMEDRETSKVGVILLDALYSPVISCNYEIDAARFGKVVDLDKLSLTVETDGSITPSHAVVEASKLLFKFFERINLWDEAEVTASGDEEKEQGEGATEEIFIEELPLPTRTINALKKHGIESLRQLADKTPEEIADIKNLGEKSVEEIEKLLKKENLR